MVKKIIASAVVVLMSAFLFCGCSSGDSGKDFLKIAYSHSDDAKKVEIVQRYIRDDDGAGVVIWTDTKISEIQIVNVIYDEHKSVLVDGDVLHSFGEIPKNQGIELTLIIPEGVPSTKVVAMKEDGKRYEYIISWDGRDDKPILIEQENEEE